MKPLLPAVLNQVGKTAFFVNELRAMEARRGLFDDPYSQLFSNDMSREMARTVTSRFPFFSLWMGARTVFIDEAIQEGLKKANQVVLLGSGLDPRALRFQAKFFEVDQAPVLDYKASVLELPSTLIRGDYTQSLDVPDEPTIYVWEGNNMYMDNTTATNVLKQILGKNAACVIMDTLSHKLARPDGRVDTGDPRVDTCLQSLMDTLGNGSNVWIGAFDGVADLGFHLTHSTNVVDLIKSVYKTDDIATLLDGDDDMAHIVNTITREYHVHIACNDKWLSLGVGKP